MNKPGTDTGDGNHNPFKGQHTERCPMPKSTKNFDSGCHQDCEASYKSCRDSGEHESVCRMKHAQCSCGCVLE
jgi:hypothetical protein